jgi:hypothetical protein
VELHEIYDNFNVNTSTCRLCRTDRSENIVNDIMEDCAFQVAIFVRAGVGARTPKIGHEANQLETTILQSFFNKMTIFCDLL